MGWGNSNIVSLIKEIWQCHCIIKFLTHIDFFFFDNLIVKIRERGYES